LVADHKPSHHFLTTRDLDNTPAYRQNIQGNMYRLRTWQEMGRGTATVTVRLGSASKQFKFYLRTECNSVDVGSKFRQGTSTKLATGRRENLAPIIHPRTIFSTIGTVYIQGTYYQRRHKYVNVTCHSMSYSPLVGGHYN